MREKKLQVFVSSTYTDLIEERQAAVEAILSSGHIPAGMELFAAGDESQMTVIERWIDESDVYLLILGGRYGSIDTKTGKSYTQLEYEYALEKTKPLFAVVIKQDALDKKVKSIGRSVIEEENPKELKEFRSIVLKNLVRFWEDKKDIKLAIHETLSEFSYTKNLVGWIRGDNSLNGSLVAEEIAKLTKENSELRDKLMGSDLSSNALYSSLTFNQLEKLLRVEKFKLEDIEIDLFDYFLSKADEFTRGYYIAYTGAEEKRACKNLAMYKLIEYRGIDYFFTEDGHNFFLKALATYQK